MCTNCWPSYHASRLVKIKQEMSIKKDRRRNLNSVEFENTMRKGEIARNEQFLLFLKCFLLF